MKKVGKNTRPFRYDLNQIPYTSLVSQMVKRLFAMWEMEIQPLGQEDFLEKKMATHSRILAGEFHGQKSLVGYSPWRRKELDMNE